MPPFAELAPLGLPAAGPDSWQSREDDPDAAARDPTLPALLNDGTELAKFVKNVLTGVLDGMRDEHGWSRTPRTIVHDKASYMVAPRSQRLTLPSPKPSEKQS